MEIIIQSLLLFISLVILAKSSDFTIDNAIKLSRIIKLKEVAIGFILLSIATNLPEITIAVMSIISGEIGITVGNVFGASIGDICIILGIIALLKPIKITSKTFKEFSTFLFYSSLIPILLLLINIGEASRIIGLFLVLLFAYFSYTSAKERIYLRVRKPVKFNYKILSFFILGVLGVIASSKLIVDSTSRISKLIGIEETWLGATAIAFTTIIPELSLCLNSIKKGRLNLTLGTLIGSSLSEITLIFGMVLILTTFSMDMNIFTTLVMFTILSNILAWRFFETDRMIDKGEGIVLLLVYCFFLFTTLGVSIIF